ncbi:hypothetical protein N7494_005448 [Penicillium frequentans]|uniref:Uncharacterized protein n=1 Tax=Penicillium frequentans TaxID=3151616 RepID=A0AAD6D0A5_9EURO|nr:hypothetical protein N7494_005448 [Penicillium glabrum]
MEAEISGEDEDPDGERWLFNTASDSQTHPFCYPKDIGDFAIFINAESDVVSHSTMTFETFQQQSHNLDFFEPLLPPEYHPESQPL